MRKLLILQKIIAPLKYRDFRLLWISQSISSFGNPFQVIALVWLILQQLKASPLDLAGAMLALAIPQALVTLGGGIVTDRFNARTVMIWSDGTRIFTSGTIALLALLGILPFWLLAL